MTFYRLGSVYSNKISIMDGHLKSAGSIKKLFRSRRLFWAWMTLFSSLVILRICPIPGSAKEPEIILPKDVVLQLDSLATRVSDKLKKSKHDKDPKILVFDFTRENPEKSSYLGTVLADKFSELLAQHLKNVEVRDRSIIKGYLKQERSTIEELGEDSGYSVAAQEMGATDAIRAYISESPDHQIEITLRRLGHDPEFRDETEFPISKDIEELYPKPSPSDDVGEVVIPPEEGVLSLGQDKISGVDRPTCISCTNPSYTNAARAAKFKQGVVVISAVVGLDGSLKSIYLLKGLPFGLTEAVLAAVKKWKMNPAKKDGKPALARVEIEVSFRLL